MAKKAAAKKAATGPKLKVYRTAIGFHDAYVAAPSKKAALAAWGTDKDLFARGAAELVDDPALTAGPLAAPGTVIRRTRGSLAEQLKAAGSAPKQDKSTKTRSTPDAGAIGSADVEPSRPAPKPKPPKPRPSRDQLDAAEDARDAARAKADADRAALRQEEDALRRRREAFEREQREVSATLDRAADEARRTYEDALTRWRAEQE